MNNNVFDLILKGIFAKNFSNIEKQRKADLKNYLHNLLVLNYLENNKAIREKSNFNIKKI